MRGGEIDLPSVHGEISVEHLLAHLLPLNSPGKFQVRELISQQVGLHETLEDGRTDSGKYQAKISYLDNFWFSNTGTCISVPQIIHWLTRGHTHKIMHAPSIYQSVGFYPSVSLSSQLKILFILFNLTWRLPMKSWGNTESGARKHC